MDGYGTTQVVLLVVAALLVGFAKTAVGGVSSISVAIFAAVMPARESTGVLLPLLIVGDVFAVTAYRSHAHWRTLLRLVPAVMVGIVAGAVFVSRVDDLVMRRTIGVVLLLLVAVAVWTRSRQALAARAVASSRRSRGAAGSAADGAATDGAATDGAATDRAATDSAATDSAADTAGVGEGYTAVTADPGDDRVWPRRAAATVYGSLTGFTTMVANAGGPVMSLYMLSMRMPMLAFLGTGAWLFAFFNLVKLPFSVGLGLLSWHSLVLDAILAPAVVVGAFVGRRVIVRLDQALFERIVLVVSVLSALNLVR